MHNGATFLINATYESPHFTAFSPYQSLKIIMNYRNRETGKQGMCETETGTKSEQDNAQAPTNSKHCWKVAAFTF